MTTISKGTEILGNLTADGDLEVSGHIDGNVAVSGSLTVLGCIKGDIEAGALVVKSGRVISQTIQIKNSVSVEADSDVAGNIRCERAVVNARVAGNLTVLQTCELHAASVIQGDISAKGLCVQPGAVLTGTLDIASETAAADRATALAGALGE